MTTPEGSARSSDEENDPEAGLDFLDFVFTLAVGIGLTPEVVGQHGLLSQEWVINNRMPNKDEALRAVSLMLGFLTLALSWFGYHASIKRRPLNYSSTWGMFRFVLDVFLVFVYGAAMLKHDQTSIVLLLLAGSYLLFVVWDVFKVLEYKVEFKEKLQAARKKGTAKAWVFRRELVSIVWCMYFGVLWAVRDVASVPCLLVFAIVGTLTYRINKNHAIWERLFGFK